MHDEVMMVRNPAGIYARQPLRLPIVGRRRLLEIEGFAIRIRFDPDRGTQPTVLMAVNGRRRELLLEVPNPFKSSRPFCGATNSDAALHKVIVRAHRHGEVCNRPHGRRQLADVASAAASRTEESLHARTRTS